MKVRIFSGWNALNPPYDKIRESIRVENEFMYFNILESMKVNRTLVD
jgi:hypothetical protein